MKKKTAKKKTEKKKTINRALDQEKRNWTRWVKMPPTYWSPITCPTELADTSDYVFNEAGYITTRPLYSDREEFLRALLGSILLKLSGDFPSLYERHHRALAKRFMDVVDEEAAKRRKGEFSAMAIRRPHWTLGTLVEGKRLRRGLPKKRERIVVEGGRRGIYEKAVMEGMKRKVRKAKESKGK